MAEYRFEVPEDMRAQAEPGIAVPDAVIVTLDPAIYHGCMVYSVYGDQRHPNDGERVAVAILLRRVLELEAKMKGKVLLPDSEWLAYCRWLGFFDGP